MRKSLYTLPMVFLLGMSTAGAEGNSPAPLGSGTEWERRNAPQVSSDDQVNARNASPQESSAAITQAQGVATAQDDQHVLLRGKIVSQEGDNEFMFSDDSGDVLVEIDDEVLNGQRISAGSEVEIQGQVNSRFWASPKVEAKAVNVVASASGNSSAPSSEQPLPPAGGQSADQG